MADSDALRMRRVRRHKAGDHSLCKRCAALKSPREPSPTTTVTDPNAELKDLAGRLVMAHRGEPENALLARELRLTLQALQAGTGSVDDDIRDLFAEFSGS